MISFVYFDVGGVVIKDFSSNQKWYEMLHELGLDKNDLKKFNDFWDTIEPLMCQGKLDLDNNVEALTTQGIKITENYSMIQDFVNRFEPNHTLWPLIKSLKSKGIGIGLLTNMYPHMLNTIKVAKLLPPVIWDVVIDSSVEKCQKPEQKIYDIAQSRSGVPSNEILFIDNTHSNLEIPTQISWQTFFYNSHEYADSTKKLNIYLKNVIGS